MKTKQTKSFETKQKVVRANNAIARKSIDLKILDEQTRPHIKIEYKKKEQWEPPAISTVGVTPETYYYESFLDKLIIEMQDAKGDNLSIEAMIEKIPETKETYELYRAGIKELEKIAELKGYGDIHKRRIKLEKALMASLIAPVARYMIRIGYDEKGNKFS